MNLLLDSAFLIDQLNGRREAAVRWRRMFEDGDSLLINEVVVCEVRAGLLAHELSIFETLLEPLEFVQPSPDAALKAGEWRAGARVMGRTLSLADSLIAAAAYSNAAAVVTRNPRDFALTPVPVETD